MSETTLDWERLWLNDFATLFAHLWYRDFPFVPSFRNRAKAADWTIHLGVAVRGAANLMGLFTHFESGGRTDAVIRDNAGAAIAAVEWEWIRLDNPTVNELGKLRERCSQPEFAGIRFACLITYVPEDRAQSIVNDVTRRWTGMLSPLLLVLIQYQFKSKRKNIKGGLRKFTVMTIHEVSAGKASLHRTQPARPWEVRGSRWEVGKDNCCSHASPSCEGADLGEK